MSKLIFAMKMTLAVSTAYDIHHSFTHSFEYSLYSTATQYYWRWSAGNTNMLVSKNAKICLTPKADTKICLTPNAKPNRESVKYRLRWVPNAKLLRWPCTFHVVCAHFNLQWNMGLSLSCYEMYTYSIPIIQIHGRDFMVNRFSVKKEIHPRPKSAPHSANKTLSGPLRPALCVTAG